MSDARPAAADPPLIALDALRKSYLSGEGAPVAVLRGISLTVRAGEFVAIVGQSGSGKSTLLNILGLLDRPSGGSYRFAGRDVGALSGDALARLRREAFGFVFQKYNLIATAPAIENVEMPAAYAGMPPGERRARAELLLRRLGLGHRMHHRPAQLSGGEQQRVSIARALMNGGHVILADEPTGALDSAAGAEVVSLLAELAAEGHTIVMITHDRAVAAAAHRVVEIRDGAIVGDSGPAPGRVAPAARGPALDRAGGGSRISGLLLLGVALRTGRLALAANAFRTGLTLLGITIGVAAVIALLAAGEGARRKLLAELQSFGTNRLYVVPGGESRGPAGRLRASDADLLHGLPNVAAVMPMRPGQVVARAGNRDHATSGRAATADFPRVYDWPVTAGTFFTRDDERSLATVAVIGTKLAAQVFPDEPEPLGRTLLVNDVPFTVIGVLAGKGALSGDSDDDDVVVLPFSTGGARVFGRPDPSWIAVLVEDLAQADATAERVAALFEEAHHVRDVDVRNAAAAIEAQDRTQASLTLLLGLTGGISLLVGGIGVMNMMLMTVSERTREIGIRVAGGARTTDILWQFLAEAAMVSGLGGVAGVGLGLAAGTGAAFCLDTPVVFSGRAIAGAAACAVLSGLVFGFWPALRAARLPPAAALTRE
ncbi:ABC transporter permease [Methylobacterium sp. JK268]